MPGQIFLAVMVMQKINKLIIVDIHNSEYKINDNSNNSNYDNKNFSNDSSNKI